MTIVLMTIVLLAIVLPAMALQTTSRINSPKATHPIENNSNQEIGAREADTTDVVDAIQNNSQINKVLINQTMAIIAFHKLRMQVLRHLLFNLRVQHQKLR